MRVTAIIRKEQSPDIIEAATAPSLEWVLGEEALSQGIKPRIGSSNSFRDRVDIHGMLRNRHRITSSLETRRGYHLAVYEVSPA